MVEGRYVSRRMVIQLKKGRDGPATLACVRADGSRTWGKEHPFFPLHDLTHCAVESVLGFDQAFFGLIATGWNIDDFAKPGASARRALESRWWDLAPGTTLEVAFPAEPL
jgi:hypothetical protein